jgi:mono/diheme cytochrome c family protein
VAPSGEAAARIRIGASIFQQFCMVCHGPDGTGSIMRASMPPIPNFTSEAFHKDHTNAQILVSILDGKGTLMPANRGRVTQEQGSDLVAYIRAFGPTSFSVQSQASDTEFTRAYQKLEQQWNELQKELLKAQGKQ